MRIVDIVRSARNIDWILIVVVLILSAVGLAAIYSVDLSRGDTLVLFPVQVFACCLGLGVLAIGTYIHVTVYRSAAGLAYLFGLLLLVGVLFFGVTVRGTTGWFRVAGFSFQPVEFAKVALILFLPYWIDRYNRRFRTWQFVFTSGFLTMVFVGLVLLQPDLGSALLLGSIWFGLLLLTKTRRRYVLVLVTVGVIAAVAAWFFVLQDYQKDRVRTFLNPSYDQLDQGYNVTQSMIAIGAGKLFGRGLGFGSQSQLHFLPEAQTDFIFAVIGEELGFVGVMIVLALFIILIWRLIHLAMRCKDDFAAYVVLAVAVLFCVQAVVNIGGTTGLLPVTGVTLPFLSYGGSSLLMNFLLISIVQSVSRSTGVQFEHNQVGA